MQCLRAYCRAAVVASTLAACSHPEPSLKAPPYESGIASWYGIPFNGRLTASGEIYDMEQLSAAHRTLRFGTVVTLHRLSNGKSVEVRINDRGPFIQGRIIDLSHAAAEKIGMSGTAEVRLQVIREPATRDPDLFSVQVATYSNRAEAEAARADLGDKYGVSRVVMRDGDPPAWRVVVGSEPTVEGANRLASQIGANQPNVFVVRSDAQ